MSKYIIVFYIVSQLFAAQSYKILGIFPSADRGNYQTYRLLFRELAQRNHHVTLITNFQMPNPPVNYHEILLSDKQDNKGLSFESVIVNEVSRVPFETLISTKEGNDACKRLMNNHEVLHMIRTQPKYSVIIAESYNSDCALALAANLTSPYIAFNPQSVHPWHFSRLGIHFNSAYVPQSLLPFGKQPWFFDRVKGFILYHVANWMFYIGSQVTDHVYLYKYLGDNLPALESIASNASLVFVNTHKSVFGGVVRADNVVDIGGIHIRPPKSLPTQIESFINEAENGVIYVNLGSNVKDFTLPSDKLTELISAFRKLQLRILWKWDGDSVENLPRNVMTMKWFPQYDILKHDNVKAFITHGGILSCLEALDAGVPVVAIPLFGEQYGNSAALVDAGIASIVTYENLKHELLLDAIDEVLDPRWQQQAKLVSRMWHDRPMTALETATYWIEYVARYNGSPNMGAPSIKVPWYQQLQLDVLAFIFIVFYIVMYAFYKVLKVCCCCCCQTEPPVERISRERTTRRVKFE